jgi:hypothetical protein
LEQLLPYTRVTTRHSARFASLRDTRFASSNPGVQQDPEFSWPKASFAAEVGQTPSSENRWDSSGASTSIPLPASLAAAETTTTGRNKTGDCKELHNQLHRPAGYCVAASPALLGLRCRRLCNGARFLGLAQPPRPSSSPQPACNYQTPPQTQTHNRTTTTECEGHSTPASSGSRTSLTTAAEHTTDPVCASWTELARPTCASPVRLTAPTRPSACRSRRGTDSLQLSPPTASTSAMSSVGACTSTATQHSAHTCCLQVSRTPSPWPRSMASRRAPRASSRRR